ncbi:MAG: aminotransferase class V-fold PLP-dependent enzyme [Tissierellia bacterium]|nr:aminotransferase class V-fold PLP-dependent enzyme [Tissierellia bacterium]
MDFNAMRKLFPVTENYIFLNNAAESPLNLKVRSKIDEYLDLVLNAPQTKPSVRYQVRQLLSDLLGGRADEYALMTSTGMGVSIVAAGYNWNKGDNVVVPSNEHWNNSFPWKALKRKGVDVRFVPLNENNRILPEAVAALTDKNTKVVAVAAVSFSTGFRSDLKKISEIAHNNGAIFIVDGIQGAGAVPINVETDCIDVLCCAGFKWLLGMPGTGFLYVNKNIQELINPMLPGMFAADLYSKELQYYPDARRYETGSIAYSLFHGWSAGLELLKEIGIENIYERILLLTDRIISGLQEKNIKIITPVEAITERSGIILFTLGSEQANKVIYEKLLKRNIIVTLRDGVIRVSPSFYNTEEEIDTFLNTL